MSPRYTRSTRGWRRHRFFRSRRRLSFSAEKYTRRSRLFPVLSVVLIVALILGASSLVLAIAWVSRTLPDPEKIVARRVAESTRIYDRTGTTLLYEIYSGEKRTYKRLDELPSSVKTATIVIEDQDFYTHRGFDVKGIFRAFVVNLLQGGKIQGGSTITQQFIKNSVLTREKTYARKLKEVVLAFEIERRFSKDQILEMYLNEIGYGGSNYGIESASAYYFRKPAEEVSIAEAALLAALPKAPTYFSPYGSHRDELLARQQHILKRMAEESYITGEEYEKARQETLVFKPREENILAPHFVLWVRELLQERYGEKRLLEGGLRVITSLDFEKQKNAEKIISDLVPKNAKQWNASNAALVALDAKTGQILTMVGSKDYFDETIDGNVNVTLRPRQPGSSFKPIVYATAFEKGYTPETLLFDVVTTFPTDIEGEYIPHNYDEKEHGVVSMRKALAGSLNIPAIKTMYLTGIGRVLDTAERLGYTTLGDRSRFGLSLVLGGGEVKLLDHVAAYATFARAGLRHDPVAILKIEDRDGNVLEEWRPEDHEGVRALDTIVAHRINSILSDNDARAFTFGQKNYLTLPDRPVAAKTGTTNDYRDAWTIGYTPSIAVGVWTGNNDNAAMKRGADGSVVAAPIWNAFMRKTLTGTPVEKFTPVEPEVVEKPVLRGEGMGETIVKIDRASGKRATALTPGSFIVEQKYVSLKPILRFIDKDNPRGLIPEDPGRDPHYDFWLRAIQEWAGKQGLQENAPPIETDDLHIPENQPQIRVMTPKDNQEITTTDPLEITVTTSAPRGVRRVDYTIDETPLITLIEAPFTWNGFLNPNMAKGAHTLTARASDDIDNVGEATIAFVVK